MNREHLAGLSADERRKKVLEWLRSEAGQEALSRGPAWHRGRNLEDIAEELARDPEPAPLRRVKEARRHGSKGRADG